MNKMNQQYKIILASNSPRRKELLAGLDINFRVEVKPGIDESYPETLPPDGVNHFGKAKRCCRSMPHVAYD